MIKSFLFSLIIYVVIFLLPVLLYIKYHDKTNPLEYLKLNNKVKTNILKGLLIGSLLIFALIIKSKLLGSGQLNFKLGYLWICGLLVGVFEEIPFRGFILQKLKLRMKFIPANIITSALFVCSHVTVWLSTNTNLITSIRSTFIVGFILGYLFDEYDSLWVPIICHSIFNICVWIGL